ncbi:MAG: hypothetical protein JNM09_06840 [Blastocatellia bacterium]|nr:hypothetical protein [Blastocatellia bacterium]
MLQLEPYKSKSSRVTCPACGHLHAFARYVDESGEHIAPEVGRCNRESKCGYHLTPKEYFDARSSFTWTPRPARTKTKQRQQPKPATLGEIPMQYLEQSLANVERNAFVKFLLSRYDRANVMDVCERYCVGDYKGLTVFWFIDQCGRINTAQMIRYNAGTGKRIKTDGVYAKDWMHAVLKRQGILPEDFDYRRGYFGEHLLTDNSSIIGIVEAQKTAVISSLELPEYVWLACFGKANLTVEKLSRYAQQRIILFPDTDGFKAWSKVATEARVQGLDVHVSDLLETELTAEQKANGWDLADYLLPLEPITAPIEVVATAPQPLVMPGIAPMTTKLTNHLATIFAGNCKRCGDYFQADGSCNLCRQPYPF